MAIRKLQAGEATIYGEYDDVRDGQFIIIWRESGQTCTVILLSGYDYGGGVTVFSSEVPVKVAEEIVQLEATDYEIKTLLDIEIRKTNYGIGA
jgi:hypothetical protein